MKNVSSLLKKDWPILILIVLGFAMGIYFYPSLPNRVPIHWNAQGQVNGYGSKLFGTFGIPVIILALYIMFVALPFIDPKRKNYRAFESTYQFLKYLLVVFFLGMQLITLLIASGRVMNQPVLIQVMVSLLFILLGNVMGRFKHNYFVGIRTPWTLANEEVWRKTHRLAAPLWVFGGILNILLALAGITFNGRGFILILAIIALVPIGYSYLVYHRLGIHN
ncbi:SdpI family protein [Desulfosporosinus sp. FKB]|uniref:SdpI family protein n=1 Tax=Desulfosporosinus sp. FKB TaxID=1969835 RepID=UPI000B49BBFB|nr:SdpI family protein [Desulfosporosinus sp. FKB]